jgi:hypothetical protein
MIARLIDSLRLLAAPPDLQLAEFRQLAGDGDEVASDFADAFLLAASCQQVQLNAAQLAALERVQDVLDEMTDTDPAAWSEAALHNSEQWQSLRKLSAQALQTLG